MLLTWQQSVKTVTELEVEMIDLRAAKCWERNLAVTDLSLENYPNLDSFNYKKRSKVYSMLGQSG